MTDTDHCPACSKKGRSVQKLTLESLLIDSAKNRLGDAPLRFCRTEDCDVVYFDKGHEQTFLTTDVKVPVFQKTDEASCPVCYCFEHTVGSIQREVAETGTSGVPESIGAKCKAGLDACEENNPLGSCCLGNVRKVVKAAVEATGGEVAPETEAAAACCSEDHCDTSDNSTNFDSTNVDSGGDDASSETADQGAHDCCAPKAPAPEAPKSSGVSAGLLSSMGAVVAAVLASACCWLPLALIGLGASTVGVAGFFEAYRSYFLAATVVLLGAGFYYVYLRKEKCAPGSACAVPNARLKRLNKISLWVATAMVILFATFPNYIGFLLGGDDAGAPVAQTPADVERVYAIQGMTCAGCVTHISSVLREVPGVKSAEVSLERDDAHVVFAAGHANDQAILAAVASAGYTARALEAAQ